MLTQCLKHFSIVATCKSITSQAINKPEMRKPVTNNVYMTSIMPICGRSEHHKGTIMDQDQKVMAPSYDSQQRKISLSCTTDLKNIP